VADEQVSRRPTPFVADDLASLGDDLASLGDDLASLGDGLASLGGNLASLGVAGVARRDWRHSAMTGVARR
jgi:hypothetical protein